MRHGRSSEAGDCSLIRRYSRLFETSRSELMSPRLSVLSMSLPLPTLWKLNAKPPLFAEPSLYPNLFLASTAADNFEIGGRFVSETSAK